MGYGRRVSGSNRWAQQVTRPALCQGLKVNKEDVMYCTVLYINTHSTVIINNTYTINNTHVGHRAQSQGSQLADELARDL